MPYPIEVYYGNNKCVHMLLIISDGAIKLINPQTHELCFNQQLNLLQKFEKDSNSNLFRLKFQNIQLICFSNYIQEIIQDVKLGRENDSFSSPFRTMCYIYQESNPFESKSLTIEVDFLKDFVLFNGEPLKKTQILDYDKDSHELLQRIKFGGCTWFLKFDNFQSARSLFTVLNSYLRSRHYQNEETYFKITPRIGKIDLGIPELQ